MAKRRKKEAKIEAVAELKRLATVKLKESSPLTPNTDETAVFDPTFAKVTDISTNSNFSSLSNLEDLHSHKPNCIKPSISVSWQDEFIYNLFEEILENFKNDESTCKYTVLVGKNILDAYIASIKRYSLKLWQAIDSNYKEAFPLMCNSLRNFIRTKFETDPASRIFLMRLII